MSDDDDTVVDVAFGSSARRSKRKQTKTKVITTVEAIQNTTMMEATRTAYGGFWKRTYYFLKNLGVIYVEENRNDTLESDIPFLIKLPFTNIEIFKLMLSFFFPKNVLMA